MSEGNLGLIPVNRAQFIRGFVESILSGSVPIGHGHPGTGKSSLMRLVVEELSRVTGKKWQLHDTFRGSQIDHTDLAGFPVVDGEFAAYKLFRHFPYDSPTPILVCLDEVGQWSTTVQSAGMQLVLDKRLGNMKLGDNIHLCALTNFASDRAGAGNLLTTMSSRLAHFELSMTSEEYVQFMREQDYDQRLTEFIRFTGKYYNFDRSRPINTTLRSHERLDKVIKLLIGMGRFSSDSIRPHIYANYDAGTAASMSKFFDVVDKLPKPEAIMANPTKVEIPSIDDTTNRALLHLFTSMLVHWADRFLSAGKIDALYKFMPRLEAEYQALFHNDLFLTVAASGKMRTAWLATPEFDKWCKANPDVELPIDRK